MIYSGHKDTLELTQRQISDDTEAGGEEATEAYTKYVEEADDAPTEVALKYSVVREFLSALYVMPYKPRRNTI